jgi:hypothetical protein
MEIEEYGQTKTKGLRVVSWGVGAVRPEFPAAGRSCIDQT